MESLETMFSLRYLTLCVCVLLSGLSGGGSVEASPHRWTPTLGAPFGINIHNLIWDGNPKAISSIVDAGIGWVRVDFDWKSMEPQKGKFNWTVSDGIVNAAVKHQLNVYATMAYAPQWAAAYATTPPAQSGPRDVADWVRFVTAVVNRYKGRISHWGIWNEPNLDHFLFFPSGIGRSTRISTYLQKILMPGIQAVKKADPDAIVLAPDLAHLGGALLQPKDHSWHLWFEEIMKGAGKQIDIISHHIYQTDYLRFLDGTPYPWEAPSLVSIMQKQGVSSKKVWISEIGWQTNKISEADAARQLKTALDEMLKRSWWNKTFFYELKDDANIPEKWGIVKADWSKKASWTAYRDYIKAHQPVSNAGGARTVKVNTAVSFDGSASKDPDGTLVAYSWDFDARDGIQSDAKGVKVSHVFTKTGVFEVTLTVTDNHGIEIGHRVKVTVEAGGVNPPKGYEVVHADSGVKIDGELSDWSASKRISLGQGNYVRISQAWGGNADLLAEGWWMWSSKGLYFAVKVTDNAHQNSFTKDLWRGDSVQIAIDADGDRAGPGYDRDGDFEYSFGLVGGVSRWERGTAPAGAANTPPQISFRRVGAVTFYEGLIPSSALVPLSFRANTKLGINFIVNDDDGQGRKGWLEWKPGIGRSKDPSLFEISTLMPGRPGVEPPVERLPVESPPQVERPKPDAATGNDPVSAVDRGVSGGDKGAGVDSSIAQDRGGVFVDRGVVLEAAPKEQGGRESGGLEKEVGVKPGCVCGTEGLPPLSMVWLLGVVFFVSIRRKSGRAGRP